MGQRELDGNPYWYNPINTNDFDGRSTIDDAVRAKILLETAQKITTIDPNVKPENTNVIGHSEQKLVTHLEEIYNLYQISPEIAKSLFIKLIIDFENESGTSTFRTILNTLAKSEQPNIGINTNIAGLLKDGFPLAALVPLPTHLQKIAILSSTMFKNVAEAWACVEKEKLLILRANTTEEAINDLPPSEKVDDDTYAVYLEDISKIKAVFRHSTDDEQAMPLPWGVTFEFLDLLKKRQWWEALELLKLSTQGPHVVLYRNMRDGKAPLLLSTALTHDINAQEDWLIHSNFFHGGNWEARIFSPSFYEKFLEFMTLLDIHPNPTDCKWKNLKEFEEYVISCVGPNRIGESIRLTLNPTIKNKQELFKIFFNTLRLCFKFSAQCGKKITVSVMDAKPGLALFDFIELMTGEKIYLSYSANDLGSGDVHKIMINNERAYEAMSKVEWETVYKSLSKSP